MTGGCCALADDLVRVNYPVSLVLNEKGDPNIDPRSDRECRSPVEVRIPFGYGAAMKIFHYGEDYELDWAMKYLEK